MARKNGRKVYCTGAGNRSLNEGKTPCGALLEIGDGCLFVTYSSFMHEDDDFVTVECPVCGCCTDVDDGQHYSVNDGNGWISILVHPDYQTFKKVGRPAAVLIGAEAKLKLVIDATAAVQELYTQLRGTLQAMVPGVSEADLHECVQQVIANAAAGLEKPQKSAE